MAIFLILDLLNLNFRKVRIRQKERTVFVNEKKNILFGFYFCQFFLSMQISKC